VNALFGEDASCRVTRTRAERGRLYQTDLIGRRVVVTFVNPPLSPVSRPRLARNGPVRPKGQRVSSFTAEMLNTPVAHTVMVRRLWTLGRLEAVYLRKRASFNAGVFHSRGSLLAHPSPVRTSGAYGPSPLHTLRGPFAECPLARRAPVRDLGRSRWAVNLA
jgi:hypothetical protein